MQESKSRPTQRHKCPRDTDFPSIVDILTKNPSSQSHKHYGRRSGHYLKNRSHSAVSQQHTATIPGSHRELRRLNPNSRIGCLSTPFLVTMRLISFISGFVLLYYFLFAKHHSHDREVSAIQVEVDDLMKEVTKTGFMRENFVEAVLPDIFQEQTNAATPLSSTKPFHALRALDETEKKITVEKKNITFHSTKEKGTSKKGSITSSMKTKKRKEKESHSDGLGKSIRASKEPLTVDVPKESIKKSQKETNSKKYKTKKHMKETGKIHEDKNISSNLVSSERKIHHRGNVKSFIPNYNYNFEKEFKDLNEDELPEEEVPLVKWKYDAILDPETSEQIFGLGNKLDHLSVYKPMCLEVATGHLISFSEQAVCGGFNRTEEWMEQYCEPMRESVNKEFLFEVKRVSNRKKWVMDNDGFIAWVDGLTVLQMLEKNCGNIAHFSGRALLLHHVLQNIASYAAPPSRVDNVLMIPTFHIMKRFVKPENYDHWHESLMKAIVSPSTYQLGTLGEFLKKKQETRMSNEQLVYLLHNISLQEVHKDKKFVCFSRVVVPGFLKARFFVDDFEYPSARPSLQNREKDAPTVPRDSLRMREKMSALIHNTTIFREKEKVILLIDRNGKRRVFEKGAKKKVVAMFEEMANSARFKFKLVSFEGIPFSEQYKLLDTASIAIGIHGANLVNTMFMPPLSVLIELFPFGFSHEMYEKGGNAGLKYFAYQMKTGEEFKGPQTYPSIEECIRLNHDCKVHYRDATMKVNDNDLQALRKILEDAIDWCNRVND